MLALASAPALADDQRVALVIGNSHYLGYPAIPACEGSARSVAASLARAGFAVRDRSDLSNATMGTELSAFADTAATAVSSVVYVCGYVASTSDRLFLLPVSARLEREGDVRTQGVVARLLAAGLTEAGQAGLILLDTVNLPGDRSPPPADGLPVATATLGVVASRSLVTSGGGTTPLALAVASAFAGPDLDVQAVIRGIAADLASVPGQAVMVREPSRVAWLARAAPAPVAVATAPAPTSAPAPASASTSAPAATPGLAPVAELDLRRVQTLLRDRGYYAGTVDGRPGPETAAAIRRFQNEMKAEMTGRLTAEQSRQLLTPTPRP